MKWKDSSKGHFFKETMGKVALHPTAPSPGASPKTRNSCPPGLQHQQDMVGAGQAPGPKSLFLQEGLQGFTLTQAAGARSLGSEKYPVPGSLMLSAEPPWLPILELGLYLPSDSAFLF